MVSTHTPRGGFALLAGIALALAVALFYRLPALNHGLPYLYDEDEAHHFNRTIRMMQSGELNPRYFHKPSLHFYLRLPVAAASFLWAVRQEQLRSVQDIETRSDYGLAGYNFTASHPSLVKGNRAFSLLFSLGVIVLIGLIASEFTQSRAVLLGATLLTALSPALVGQATVIGVDMPLSFFVLAAVWAAVKYGRSCNEYQLSVQHSWQWLIGVAIFSGLALSTKYNALPIALLPLWLCLLYRNPHPTHWLLAGLVPPLTFLAASPFILVSLPLFLNHLAYEIWHYGVAGHVGQSADPGWSQVLHYSGWLATQGIGATACVAALLGTVVLLKQRPRLALTLLFFPVLYFALMAAQKANFTRNFLVMIPFVALLAAAPLMLLAPLRKLSGPSSTLLALLYLCVIAFGPVRQAGTERLELAQQEDSRNAAFQWLSTEPSLALEVALDGKLQLPRFVNWKNGKAELSRFGISRRPDPLSDPLALYLQGYDLIVSGPTTTAAPDFLKLERTFAGDGTVQRIVRHPEIKVWRLLPTQPLRDLAWQQMLEQPAMPLELEQASAAESIWICAGNSESEPYCWINSRLNRLAPAAFSQQLPTPQALGLLSLSIELMTPWPKQQVALSIGDWRKTLKLEDRPGKWRSFKLQIPRQELTKAEDLILEVRRLHAPATQGLSSDKRRLGVALRRLKISS